jgi:hypothetical protein
MNQEPVALVSVRFSNEPYTFSQLKMLPNGTHELYTAPRELSDEEILNSWEGIDPSEECWISDEQLKQFARRILKKASEK